MLYIYIYALYIYMLCIHNARWRHLSELKASEVYSFQNIYNVNKTGQLKPGKGATIWCVMEPDCSLFFGICGDCHLKHHL